MWDEISDGLKALLQANTLIQGVFDWEQDTFTGDPIVCVFASGNTSAYRTTTENERVYAFTIRCYVARSGARTAQDAELVMRDLVDSIIDDLDKAYYGQGLGIALPAGYTITKLEAAPSRWGYADLGESYRVAEIEVQIYTDVDVTVIT